jgi:hypothetical protein
VWETAYNYTEQREIFRCDFGPRNGADNISDTDGCFGLFFDEEITQQIVRETYRNVEQYIISIICEIMDTCENK